MKISDLSRHPNPLARDYTHFRVTERILMSGHSHQGWPDCGRDAQLQAWDDAACHVDEKWERAFARAQQVREGFGRLLGTAPDEIALGQNTFDLVVSWLSGLPWRERSRLITTEGEFHTIRRLLDRLVEEGVEIHKVPAEPVGEIAPRLAAAVDGRTAAVLVSCVLYQNARIVPGLGEVMQACRRHGAELLIDAYHALNAVPFRLAEQGLEDAYVTGAGYKYLQLGEGNGFLRFPRHCVQRPLVTGWFSEFGLLTADQGRQGVAYGEGPLRYAGATYDPTSHYRAAAVFDFFRARGLTPDFLREISQHQIELLVRQFDDLDLDPAVIDRDRDPDLAKIGGFLALRSPQAGQLRRRLHRRDVWCDHRGDILRLGPAPYLSDRQLRDAMTILGEVARAAG